MRLPAITVTVTCLALAGCGAGEPEYGGVEPAAFAKATCTGGRVAGARRRPR
ncbi:hypothetical protein [Tessaracoccus flavescens]|uniref:hypothetical protein n=1 Tax=Tessaracoccus flavescens TaxID=399497 RepID=UPI0013747618|nr:hypothetical protein [Tessaracoccus flavescens]